MTQVLLGITLGFTANVLAEYFLSDDLERPYYRLDRYQRWMRMSRWCVVCIGTFVLALLQTHWISLLLVGLLSVTASTDLETKFLPPDKFVYASTIVGVVLASLMHGLDGLRDALIAQAFCFAVVTLGVALFNLCDSGDIKLSMQFGAVCASLPNVATAALGTWVAACVLFLLRLIYCKQHMSWSGALKLTAAYRPPQGPLLLVGILFMAFISSVGKL